MLPNKRSPEAVPADPLEQPAVELTTLLESMGSYSDVPDGVDKENHYISLFNKQLGATGVFIQEHQVGDSAITPVAAVETLMQVGRAQVSAAVQASLPDFLRKRNITDPSENQIKQARGLIYAALETKLIKRVTPEEQGTTDTSEVTDAPNYEKQPSPDSVGNTIPADATDVEHLGIRDKVKDKSLRLQFKSMNLGGRVISAVIGGWREEKTKKGTSSAVIKRMNTVSAQMQEGANWLDAHKESDGFDLEKSDEDYKYVEAYYNDLNNENDELRAEHTKKKFTRKAKIVGGLVLAVGGLMALNKVANGGFLPGFVPFPEAPQPTGNNTNHVASSVAVAPGSGNGSTTTTTMANSAPIPSGTTTTTISNAAGNIPPAPPKGFNQDVFNHLNSGQQQFYNGTDEAHRQAVNTFVDKYSHMTTAQQSAFKTMCEQTQHIIDANPGKSTEELTTLGNNILNLAAQRADFVSHGTGTTMSNVLGNVFDKNFHDYFAQTDAFKTIVDQTQNVANFTPVKSQVGFSTVGNIALGLTTQPADFVSRHANLPLVSPITSQTPGNALAAHYHAFVAQQIHAQQALFDSLNSDEDYLDKLLAA